MTRIFVSLAIVSFGLASAVANAADPEGSGPGPAVAYSDASLPTHTIYRPGALDGTYPVVLWGNGSCVDSNFGYREFLAELASHGFIVLAIGPYRDTPPPVSQRPEDPADWPPFETHYSQLLDALDWITAEADRPGSVFMDRVDLSGVATIGHSCGGLQSIKASVDPRITTAVVLNSGMLPDGGPFASGPLAWLQWQLKGSTTAARLFVGEQCGLCTDADWSLRRHFPE